MEKEKKKLGGLQIKALLIIIARYEKIIRKRKNEKEDNIYKKIGKSF